MRVLIAGFGPFPGAPVNPSGVLAKSLVRRRRPALAGIVRKAHVFATSYASVDRDLPQLLADKPDIVLLFGVAGRRHQICIETRARNAISVLFPDASGYRPSRGTIRSGGPDALTGNAPFARLLGATRASKVPARLSRDTGGYLCNYVYWRALERAPERQPVVQFVHVPPISLTPQRRRRGSRRALSLARLIVGAESLLIALVAASQR